VFVRKKPIAIWKRWGWMKSWVESANDSATDFPLENLPFGVFQDGIGVAIGDYVLSLGTSSQAGFLEGLSAADNQCHRGQLPQRADGALFV